MARPRKAKQGVQPGFPKLAIYTGKTLTHSYGLHWYNSKSYFLEQEDLIVLVAKTIRKDYENCYIQPGQWWRTYPLIDMYHMVPLKVLEEKLMPITCTYNWKQRYTSLPTIRAKDVLIIEKDNGEGTSSSTITI